MKSCVAVFHPEGNINNNSSLTCMVKALLEDGFMVHYLGHIAPHIPYQIPIVCGATPFLYSENQTLPLWKGEYAFVIGVDEGLIEAADFAQLNGCGLVFVSYEIMYGAELHSSAEIERKIKIIAAAKNINLCIVQDSGRAADLSIEYNIAQNKMFYVPVGGDAVIPYTSSNFLHTILKIPAEKKILLHMGSLTSWSMVEWSIEHAHTLPSDWVLVLHNRYGGTSDLQRKYSGRPNVYWSNQCARTQEELAQIIQSADCCLALYKATYEHWSCGRNIGNIGLASGKIASALQHGRPLAVNDLGLVSSWVTQDRIGVHVDVSSPEPFRALNMLTDDDMLSDRCHAAFTTRLSFSRVKKVFLKACMELPAQQGTDCPSSPCEVLLRKKAQENIYSYYKTVSVAEGFKSSLTIIRILLVKIIVGLKNRIVKRFYS